MGNNNEKKICILCTANLKHMTLISLYTEIFDKENVKYDIIYIDKYGNTEKYEGANSLYRYELHIESDWSFVKKFTKYWKFRKYAINIINKNKYDFIVVWNEFTAFMFSDFLKSKYPDRYCVNIRDQNMNKLLPVQMRYKQAMSKCCFATVSSERFKEIFPKYDYLFIHSSNNKIIKDLIPVKEKRKENEPLRIVFVGRLSYPDTMKAVIKAIGNDKRFEMRLVGERCDSLIGTDNDIRYENVFIKGAFSPNETAMYLKDADIIYSLNAENDVHSDTLLPIKMYYAIAKHIPILAFKSSFTYDYALEHNMAIGITTQDYGDLGDIIYKQYFSLSQAELDAGCDKALTEIKKSHDDLKARIKKYIL